MATITVHRLTKKNLYTEIPHIKVHLSIQNSGFTRVSKFTAADAVKRSESLSTCMPNRR